MKLLQYTLDDEWTIDRWGYVVRRVSGSNPGEQRIGLGKDYPELYWKFGTWNMEDIMYILEKIRPNIFSERYKLNKLEKLKQEVDYLISKINKFQGFL